MKILFITEVGSIHAARWVNQLKDTEWDVRVFQALPAMFTFRYEFQTGHFYLPYPIETPEGLEADYTLANTYLVKSPTIIKRAIVKEYGFLGRLTPSYIFASISRAELSEKSWF